MNRKKWRRLCAFLLGASMLLTSFGSPALDADATKRAEVNAWNAMETRLEEKTEDLPQSEYDGYIIKLKEDLSPKVSLAMEEEAEDTPGIEAVEYAEDLYTAESLEDAQEFTTARNVEYIEPNYLLEMYDSDTELLSETNPDDTYYTSGDQWNLDQMNVGEAWALGLEGQDMDGGTDMDYDGDPDNDEVVVAVIDSGLKEGHEDIDWSRVLPGYNFLDTSNASDTNDTQGHGTFVSGLMMATKDNGKGIAGISQNIYVMPLKVFNSRTTATSVIINAINYAAEQKENFDASKGQQGTNISVINMSLGGETAESSLQSAVERAIDAGIIVICAAGNEGDMRASYPAQYAIGVGSTDSAKEVSYYSQRLSLANGTGYENKVWVMAPGENVTSTYMESNNSYYTGSGTSFSCPEVSALAALAVSLKNDLTEYYPDSQNNHEAFRQLLKETAVPKSGSAGEINGQDVEYGWGIVDFGQTLTALIGEVEGEGKVFLQAANEAGSVIPDAEITVTDTTNEQVISPNEDGSYTLQLGRRYQYAAEADRYQAKTGILVTLSEERTVTVTLAGQTYKTRFDVRNSRGNLINNPEITVSKIGGGTVTQNQDGSFSTGNGNYLYTVSAGGYFPQSGSFVIDDLKESNLEENGKLISLTVHGDIDVCSVKMTAIGAEGTDITDDTIVDDNGIKKSATTITVLNSQNVPQEVYTDGYYKLEPDTYTYTVENEQYKTVSGSFIIREEDKDTAQEQKVYLSDRVYNVYFDIFPLYAARLVTVTNGLGEVERPVVDDMDIRYRLCDGTYRYRVESAGYQTLTGTFTVNGKTTNVELRLEKGSGVVDDGTSDTPFLTINTSLFPVSDLQDYQTKATYTIGDVATEVTGITMTDLIEHFTNPLQEASGVSVRVGEDQEYTISAEDFERTMIAWQDDQLYLATDGAEVMIADPQVVTVLYHVHQEVTDVLKEATCTEPGLARYTCTQCGNVREAELPALGHDYDPNTGICTRCGDSLELDTDTEIMINDTVVTSAEMRQYTTYATYTMVSYTGEETHSVVGILLSDLVEHFLPDKCVPYVTITALDYSTMGYSRDMFDDTMIAWEIDGLPPGSYDYDNHLRVAVDGGSSGMWLYSPALFEANTTDHQYGAPETVAPTCVKDGYTKHVCSVCGHEERYDIVSATGEHNWDISYVQKEATCTEGGGILYYCGTCGMSKLVDSDPLGHHWNNQGICDTCDAVLADGAVVVTKDQEQTPVAQVTPPAEGWRLHEENTFTVSSEKACAVLVKNDDRYERLEGVKQTEDSYQFSVTWTEDTTVFVLLAGDANFDGTLDVRDAMLTREAVSAKIEPSGRNLALDVNKDEQLDNTDVTNILSAALKKSGLDW